MKKIDINTYTEACENLRIAKMSFNAGSQDIALEKLELLAYYVVSDRAKSMVEADKLNQLAEEVKEVLDNSHAQAKNASGKSHVSYLTCSVRTNKGRYFYQQFT